MFFFFNDTATTEIYTLSLHDALPICGGHTGELNYLRDAVQLGAVRTLLKPFGNAEILEAVRAALDRKSTRLNSSHGYISYAVFCLKKKKRKRLIATSSRHQLIAHTST